MLRSAADNLVYQLHLLRVVHSLSCKCQQWQAQALQVRVGNHRMPQSIMITRNYARQAPRRRPEMTIQPLDVETTGTKIPRMSVHEAKRSNIAPQSIRRLDDPLDPQLKRDIENLDDDDLEPDLSSMSFQYDIYQMEKQALYNKTRRLAATRKHYKEFRQPEKEISLLTYAEKEKIRYLHLNEQWTAEMIAEAFPITVAGAEKLLRSSYQLRTDKEIVAHDERLIRRLKKIETGEIEVDPYMEESLAKRSAQTLFVGAKWNPTLFVDGTGGFDMTAEKKANREPGEFERLVMIPAEGKKKVKETQLQVASATSSSSFSQREHPPDPDKTPREPQSQPRPMLATFGDEVEDVRDIRSVLPDYDGGEEEKRFRARIRKLDAKKPYTLAEFERVFGNNP